MMDKLVPWRKRTVRQAPEWDEHPFDLLHREINELFDSYYRGVGRMGRRTIGSAGFELSETDDEIRVKVELPGMDEKDVQVAVEEDVLTIRGERKEEQASGKRNYHVSEIRYGGFVRSIPLPAEVDAEKAKARFTRGLLTLTLPKTGAAREGRRRIPVSEGR